MIETIPNVDWNYKPKCNNMKTVLMLQLVYYRLDFLKTQMILTFRTKSFYDFYFVISFSWLQNATVLLSRQILKKNQNKLIKETLNWH